MRNLIICLSVFCTAISTAQNISDSLSFPASWQGDWTGTLEIFSGKGKSVQKDGWNACLYRTEPPKTKPCAFTAIPYFAWENRKPGGMRVWFPTGPDVKKKRRER